MQKLINITLKAAAAILAVILAASCVFEKDDAIRGNDRGMNNVLVQIGVSADGMTQTKADVIPGTDQERQRVETAISTLRLYAYIDNVLSGYAYVPEYSSTDKIYMDLKNLPSSGTKQVEFVAVANEGSMNGIDGIDIEVGTNPDGTISLPSNFGRNSFGGIKYTIANQSFANGMPMYATKTVTIDVDKVGNLNTADGHNGHFILQETVNLILTRSLAKIMVYAAQAVDGTDVLDTQNPSITIDKVTYFTEGILESGYLFPTENYPDDITTNDDIVFEPADGGVKKMIGTQNTSNIGVPANYTPITDPYYIPENPNGADTWNQVGDTEGMVIRIDYTYTGSSSTFAYVKMPPMVRNTFYKVLCLINAAGKIEIKYIVTDWIIADINVPNFE